MSKFRIRHLLLATASCCAFLGWAQMDRKWYEFKTFVVLDGEIIQTENGPVGRLFYSRRSGYYDSDGIEVSPPAIDKSTAYWIVGISFLVSIAGLRILQKRSDRPIYLGLEIVRIMTIAVLVYQVPALLSWLAEGLSGGRVY